MLRKINLLLLYQWNSTVKVSWQLIAQETLQCHFLSNVSIRILGSCKFQLYGKFYSATISLHNRRLLSNFYMNIQKTSEFFASCFTLQSVCHVYFLLVELSLLPVIFSSRMLSNTEHWLECFCYLVIRSNNIFQTHFYHFSLS